MYLREKLNGIFIPSQELRCEKKLYDDQNVERIGTLEDQVSKLQKDLANEEKSHKCFKEQCQEKENELKSTRTLIAAKEQEIILLNQKNFDLSAAQLNVDTLNENYKSQLDASQQNVDDLNKDLQNTREELGVVKTKLTKSKSENDLYNTLLKEKDKDLNNAESKRLAVAYKISSMEETINELTAENQVFHLKFYFTEYYFNSI